MKGHSPGPSSALCFPFSKKNLDRGELVTTLWIETNPYLAPERQISALLTEKQTAPAFTEARRRPSIPSPDVTVNHDPSSVKRNDEIIGLFEDIADEFDEAITDVLDERATRWEPRT